MTKPLLAEVEQSPLLTAEDPDQLFDVIPFLSLDEQAKHCDCICKRLASNRLFGKNQLEEAQQNPQFEQWNATSVGNCAFMVLYAPDPAVRLGFLQLLNDYKAYRERYNKRWLLRKVLTVGAVVLPLWWLCHEYLLPQ